jgi:murein DD-endopeptidase MepM/ murein hydrolase activator NlpD
MEGLTADDTWSIFPMRLRPAGVALAIAAALVVGLLAPASADDSLDQRKKSVQSQISGARSQIETLSVRAATAATALTSAQSALSAAQAEADDTMRALAAATGRDEAIGIELQAAIGRERGVQVEVTTVRTRMTDTQRLVGLIARQTYQQGGTLSELSVALQAQSLDDFAGRLEAVQSVARAQNALFARLAVDRADLAAKQAALEAARADTEQRKLAAAQQVRTVAALSQQAQSARTRVASLVSQRRSALQAVAAARADELHKLTQLQAEQRRINALIAASASRGGGNPSGDLLWPVDGAPLTQGVGARIHPVYGYKSCHTGIDLGASTGTPIRAAASGVVLSTSSGGAYGNLTLIDHGDGLTTFYAHQTAFAVSQGQRVSRGQVIGYVGSTGWVTGPHLHFEVHINGVPYNPLGWFGGSRTPVVC